jgi:hypothetical protein
MTPAAALLVSRPVFREAITHGSQLALLEAWHAGASDDERATLQARYDRLWDALSAWLDDGKTPRPNDVPDLAPRLVAALAGACLMTYKATPTDLREEVLPAFCGAQDALESWFGIA